MSPTGKGTSCEWKYSFPFIVYILPQSSHVSTVPADDEYFINRIMCACINLCLYTVHKMASVVHYSICV